MVTVVMCHVIYAIQETVWDEMWPSKTTMVRRANWKFRHSASLVMPNSYPSNGIVNQHLITIKNSYNISRSMTKLTKWHVRPAKTQISLGIRPVWSGSSLSAWRNLWPSANHWAHREGSDQTGRMPRLLWVFAGCTCHFVDFVMRQLIYELA